MLTHIFTSTSTHMSAQTSSIVTLVVGGRTTAGRMRFCFLPPKKAARNVTSSIRVGNAHGATTARRQHLLASVLRQLLASEAVGAVPVVDLSATTPVVTRMCMCHFLEKGGLDACRFVGSDRTEYAKRRVWRSCQAVGAAQSFERSVRQHSKEGTRVHRGRLRSRRSVERRVTRLLAELAEHCPSIGLANFFLVCLTRERPSVNRVSVANNFVP